MDALEPQYLEVLKNLMLARYVPLLPALLPNNKRPTECEDKQISRALSAFALQKLLGLTPEAAAAAVVDDFDDKGIDAVYYDPIQKQLYLVQSKLKSSQQFQLGDAQRFCDGVRLFLRKDFYEFNDNVKRRSVEFSNSLRTCDSIELIVCFTGTGYSQSADQALNAMLRDQLRREERLLQEPRYYTPDQIKRDLLAEQAYAPVSACLGLYHCERVDEPRPTYYGMVSLLDLVALHNEKEHALYDRNIRHYIGSAKSDVNKAIKRTLETSPADFFYLNNGVTAVCDHIRPRGETPEGIKELDVEALSIINGAQTVASAAEFAKQNPGKLTKAAKVMFTLIKASANDGFGKEITKARNHQNAVQNANFAALDDTQERLRREALLFDITYQYRPEVGGKDSPEVIRIIEAARALALLHVDPRYPTWLKNEPAELSDPRTTGYQGLFAQSIGGLALINAVTVSRVLIDKISEHERTAGTKDQENLIYRYSDVLIVAVIMKRYRMKIAGDKKLDTATLNDELSRPLDDLRQQAFDLALRQLNGASPQVFFKSMQNTIPFLIDLMKINFDKQDFQLVTDVNALNKLQEQDKSPEHDLAERLAKAAPQL